MKYSKNEKYKKFAEMPEGGGDLCPTSDEAFDLVRKMQKELKVLLIMVHCYFLAHGLQLEQLM